jgi:zinc protease
MHLQEYLMHASRFAGRSRIAASLLILLVLLIAPVHAKGLWPHDGSDLKPDPTIKFGVLPNGMRYAIKPNRNPEGTVTLKLRIAAGSLHENENERGIAHFLEHMAFNGSKNYPEGEMFRALQRMGIQIGSNANAATDFDNTSFTISLPSVRPQVVDTGLNILREMCDRLTLAQDAIVKERGVILSEERSRDTPSTRANIAQIKLLFAGQKYPTRFPIGDTNLIRRAGEADLRGFYERNYRPDAALLVIAGDVNPAAMEAKIAATFGSWAKPATPRPAENFGQPKPRGIEVVQSIQPGLDESVSLNWVIPEDTRPDNKARRREVHARLVAFTVLNRRLSKLARLADAPYIDARIEREMIGGAGIVTALSVRTKPGEWQKGLAAAEQELRRALVHGLQQAEVDREALEQKSPYNLTAANANTRANNDVADLVLASVDSNRVPTDPQTDLALYTASITGLKAQTVTQVLKASVGNGGAPLIFFTSSKPVDGGDTAIKTAYVGSTKVAVAAPPPSTIKQFTYRDFGPKGTVAERRTVSDLGATLVRFANGVRLNVKPTSYEKDKVSVIARFKGGYLALPKNKKGVAWALPFAFVEGGLGQLEIGELEQTEPGHFAGIFLSVDEDAFQLSGDTVERDVLLQLQVLAAYMTDPAYRTDGLRRIQAAGDGQVREQSSSPMGVLARDIGALMRDNDPRWASPSLEDMRALTMADIKAAIAPSLANAPIEITIVGHVKVDAAIEATAKTFGAFAPRPATFQYPAGALDVRFPAKRRVLEMRHEGREDQAAVAAAWPGPDLFSNVRRERAIAILNEILQLRLIDEVREAQGSTYTPFGTYFTSPIVKGHGYLLAGVEPKPDQIDLFFSTLAEIERELTSGPVGKDLLERARKPVLYQHYAAESTNAYWLEALQNIQSDPRNLDRIRSQIDDYAQITAEEVAEAARAFLDSKRRIDIRVLPK